ncbi:MAG: hypothetical protein PHN38_05445 [Sulfurospirillaceae bacterium]|nr:hypothetical protein [Sulfurospirillaceae bacterium]
MKNIILILFPVFALGGLFFYLNTVYKSPTDIINKEKIPLEYKDNTVQCPQCNMFLVGKKYTAQVITSDNKTHFFDDVGCVVLWFRDTKKDEQKSTIWVFTLDTNRWIDARKSFYSLSDDTPMKYGFGAYEQKKEGFIVFEEMRLKMLRGENMSDPKIRKQLLGK